MASELADRVVAVTADRGPGADGGRYAYGTGCLVNGSTVLTAAHVVAGAQRVWTRTPAWSRHEAAVDVAFVGDPGHWHPDHPAAPDLALITVGADLDPPPLAVARVDRTHRAGLIERARSLGYPWFGEQDLPGEDPVRLQVPVHGVVLLSNREDGRLVFEVSVAPPNGLSGSQWAGMSGAPVVANGRLIGVITEHPGRSGSSTVNVTALDALDADPAHPSWGAGVRAPDAWWARLGVTSGGPLAVLPPPEEADYRATLREFGAALHSRMPQLRGRDGELADIAAFATGSEAYLWLVGGAYRGKSALLYEAVTSGVLPDTVDVVAYFLNRRAGDASGDRFLQAVVPQMEILWGCEHTTPTKDRFNTAWQQLAANARGDGRHLLLVVDALDEDLHQPGTSRVVDLLPRLTTTHSHVLVTSRPYSRLHDDLDSTDPLAQARTVKLAQFPGSADLAKTSTAELDELISAGPLARDIVGIMAAAAGPLSPSDLAALHGAGDHVTGGRWEIEDLLAGAGSRSLEPVGPREAPRYQFAHDALLEHARGHDKIAKYLGAYCDRFDVWAETWRSADWPDPSLDGSGTPHYLFDTYPTVLATVGGQGSVPAWQRLTALVGDRRWTDVALSTIGPHATGTAVRAAIQIAREDAAAKVAANQDAAAAAMVVRCAVIQAELDDTTPLVSGELALQLVRRGIWSDRRALGAVLDLENDGRTVRDLGTLSPVLTPESLQIAIEKVTSANPVGWEAMHGASMGALTIRLAELSGIRAAVEHLCGLPPGTSRAIAVLTLLAARPDAADEGAASLLIQELAAIQNDSHYTDVCEVLDRVADSISSQALATALRGSQASTDEAIAFLRRCFAADSTADLPAHISPWPLGAVAPWLDQEQLEAALAELVDDVEHLTMRDRDGAAVGWFDTAAPGTDPFADSIGVDMDQVYIRTNTTSSLLPVARRLPPELAARAVALTLSRLEGDWRDQELAAVAVAAARRLPLADRRHALAPMVDHLDALLGHGGSIGKVEDIASGLAESGFGLDIFRAAAAKDTGMWIWALVRAAPLLDASSMPEALDITRTLNEMDRKWLLRPLLGRLAFFGAAEAREAVRLGWSLFGDHERAASDALRDAATVPLAGCDPTDPEPEPDAALVEHIASLLSPRPGDEVQYTAIQKVISYLPRLTVDQLTGLTKAIERVYSTMNRNELRRHLAVALARRGALDAALAIYVDPHSHLTVPSMQAILRVTPDSRLDDWLRTVQASFRGDLQPAGRDTLMAAAAPRLAQLDRQAGWVLLGAWLHRRGTRTERLIDLKSYAPVVRRIAGDTATDALAAWIDGTGLQAT